MTQQSSMLRRLHLAKRSVGWVKSVNACATCRTQRNSKMVNPSYIIENSDKGNAYCINANVARENNYSYRAYLQASEFCNRLKLAYCNRVEV